MVFSERSFIDVLERYVAGARWWPWKGVTKKVKVVELEAADPLLYILFEVDGLRFQLPLRKTTSIPSGLETRGFCTNGSCYVEAEYFPDYLELFSKLPGSRVDYRIPLEKVASARPLSLESTNSVALYETPSGKFVLKSYRLVPGVNLEYMLLKRLSDAGFKHIPTVAGFLTHRSTPAGVLTRYVKGVGDGGKPFYDNLMNELSGRSERRKLLAYSSKLGVMIAEMHIALNPIGEKGFYGVEEVEERDVEKWVKRCERYLESSLKRLSQVAAAIEGEEREVVEYWARRLDEASAYIRDQLSDLFSHQVLLYKGRCHQDLHLAQMVFDEENEEFYITDFEGEPGRSDEERATKEPLLRDIASMIRSIHYLAHAAIVNHYGISPHRASLKMLESDPTEEWRKTALTAMLYSYLPMATSAGLLSASKARVLENPWAFLKPWVLERALYEAFYESMYRPLWASIPIAGIVELLKQ